MFSTIKIGNLTALLGAIAFLFLAGTSLWAADPTHHFVLNKPAKVIVGEKVTLGFAAVREDGTQIADAKHSLKLFVATREKTQEHKVSIRKGAGSIELAFDHPGIFILQAEDSRNSDLTLSGSIKVDPAVSRDMGREVLP